MKQSTITMDQLPNKPVVLSVVELHSDPLASLKRLCDLVIQGECPYEDMAEQIEDRAYELCDKGDLHSAVQELIRVTLFFESLTEKNDEQCRDLADAYLLIGQIHQFSGLFVESIGWFSKSAVVDDCYPAPFHSMAASFLQLQQFDNAIKCLEQELTLSPGNYYSYLLLADLYEKTLRPDDAEKCLKNLLERDPENIQCLHSLIRHYECTDRSIDTGLLVKRLMGITKQYSKIEIMIKCYYLCKEGKHVEVLDFIESQSCAGDSITITDLIKAHIYSEMRYYKKSRRIVAEFKTKNHGRYDVMSSKLNEFKSLFGEPAAENIRKMMLFFPPEAKKAAAG